MALAIVGEFGPQGIWVVGNWPSRVSGFLNLKGLGEVGNWPSRVSGFLELTRSIFTPLATGPVVGC